MDIFNQETNKRSAAFEAAALGLGVISIATCACIYISVVCGSLAIIFAILSKGGANTMSPRAHLAIWLGIFGLGLTVILSVYAVYSALAQYGSFENILKAYGDITGQDFESIFPELTQ